MGLSRFRLAWFIQTAKVQINSVHCVFLHLFYVKTQFCGVLTKKKETDAAHQNQTWFTFFICTVETNEKNAWKETHSSCSWWCYFSKSQLTSGYLFLQCFCQLPKGRTPETFENLWCSHGAPLRFTGGIRGTCRELFIIWPWHHTPTLIQLIEGKYWMNTRLWEPWLGERRSSLWLWWKASWQRSWRKCFSSSSFYLLTFREPPHSENKWMQRAWGCFLH